jgi:hypothetical protein
MKFQDKSQQQFFDVITSNVKQNTAYGAKLKLDSAAQGASNALKTLAFGIWKHSKVKQEEFIREQGNKAIEACNVFLDALDNALDRIRAEREEKE